MVLLEFLNSHFCPATLRGEFCKIRTVKQGSLKWNLTCYGEIRPTSADGSRTKDYWAYSLGVLGPQSDSPPPPAPAEGWASLFRACVPALHSGVSRPVHVSTHTTVVLLPGHLEFLPDSFFFSSDFLFTPLFRDYANYIRTNSAVSHRQKRDTH